MRDRTEQVTDVVHALASALRGFQEMRQLLGPAKHGRRVLVACVQPRLRARVHEALHQQHQLVDCFGYADVLVRLATDAIDAVIVEDQPGQIGPQGDLLCEVRRRWPLLRCVLIASRRRGGAAALEPGAAHVLLRASFDSSALLASLHPDRWFPALAADAPLVKSDSSCKILRTRASEKNSTRIK